MDPALNHPAPQFQPFDRRRRANVPGFINHTPRDFDLKAARSAVSARHAPGSKMSFTTVCAPVQATLSLQEAAPSIRVRSWHQEKQDPPMSITPAPAVKRSRFMQPRDEKALDHTAVDMAYFLRDTPPPRLDLSDLESTANAKGSSTPKRLRRVLKFGMQRPESPSPTGARNADPFKPINAVQKVSSDGTKYLQIVLPEPLNLRSITHLPHHMEESSQEPKSFRNAAGPRPQSTTVTQSRSEPTLYTYAHMKDFQQALAQPSTDGSDEDDVEPYAARNWIPASTGATKHEEREVNLGFAKRQERPEQLRDPSPDSAISSIQHKRSHMLVDDQDPDCMLSTPRSNTPKQHENATDTTPQFHVILATPPGKPLPSVPESRIASPRASAALQVMCNNGQPVPDDKVEKAPNQGIRRISRDQVPITLYAFPAAPSYIPSTPSYIPARPKSARTVSINGRESAASIRPTLNRNDSSTRGERAERTRARKLRDLHNKGTTVHHMVKKSEEALSQVSQHVEKDMLHTTEANPEPETKPGTIGICPIMLVADQAPIPRPEERLSELFQSILREHHTPPHHSPPHPSSVALRSSLPLPAIPQHHQAHQSHSSVSSHVLSEADTHPAFRQRSQSPPSLQALRPSSSENLSRATTPNEALSSFHSNSTKSYRGTATSPAFDRSSRLEARIDMLERENRLLDAALRAVLQTAGSLNGCPCRGTGHHVVMGEDVGKRESSGSMEGSEGSALDLYMNTRGSVGGVTR